MSAASHFPTVYKPTYILRIPGEGGLLTPIHMPHAHMRDGKIDNEEADTEEEEEEEEAESYRKG